MNTVAKKLQPRTWRSEAAHQRYETERQNDVTSQHCPLCDAPTIESYIHWIKIENIYPYDAIAIQHDMLITKRHIGYDRELSDEERAELSNLKESTLNETYAMIMEALPKNRSIPGHYHLHLIVPKVIT